MPNLKRIAPTGYELFRTNFRPDREIELLVLQNANQSDVEPIQYCEAAAGCIGA
jgi:hypothetical protein